MIFTITEKGVDKRLDVFLKELFPKLSRAQIKKEIKRGNVKILFAKNRLNRKIKAGNILKQGDKIRFIPQKEGAEIKPDDNIKINVVYKDKDIIIINKPAGLVVHPSRSTKNKTLVNGLLAAFPEIKDVGEDASRPGIVHRLDKNASGLMVVARNQKSFLFLKKQFQNREVKKKYLALAQGDIKQDDGILISFIARSKSNPDCQIAISEKDIKNLRKTKNAKMAETRFKVLKRFGDFTLCEASPKTGRTHQIRVHFAHLRHPLAGDQKYGFDKKTFEKKIGKFALNRFFLHSCFLEFEAPSGEKLKFNSALPKELKKFLAFIKSCGQPQAK